MICNLPGVPCTPSVFAPPPLQVYNRRHRPQQQASDSPQVPTTMTLPDPTTESPLPPSDLLIALRKGIHIRRGQRGKQRFVISNVINGTRVEHPRTDKRRLSQTSKRCTCVGKRSHGTRKLTILTPFEKFIEESRFVGGGNR